MSDEQPFDVLWIEGKRQLRPLTEVEANELDTSVHDFNRIFNEGLLAEYRFKFDASPSNLADLDYDFYEFGGTNWYRDNGYGFTCAWAAILVKSFGFEWAALQGTSSLQNYLLYHRDAYFIFFPWHMLWSIVESGGSQHDKAFAAWVRILEQVDGVYGVPGGWHPAIDAIYGANELVPLAVVNELKRLRRGNPFFFYQLGLEPYDWSEKSDWDAVARWINALVETNENDANK